MEREVKRVACVGAGLVGQGWAALLKTRGYQVVLCDLTEEKLEEAEARVEGHVATLLEAGLLEGAEGGLLEATTSLGEALEGADYVIESIYEDLEAKRRLFAEMDQLAPSHVVLASSTSGFTMSEMGRDMGLHPERALVAHPWNPVHLVPLVEVCPSPKTSPRAVDTTMKLMEDLGRVPVLVRKEVPGFIANRLSAVLWREALHLVDTGVASAEDVDKAVSAGPGIRWAFMGPFMTYHLGGGKGGIKYLMDHIGTRKEAWLETMATWTRFPESAKRKAVSGVQEMVGDTPLEELEAWRDRYLVELNKLIWARKGRR